MARISMLPRAKGMIYTEARVPLRDYFAARALEALIARAAPYVEDYPRDIAEEAYRYADAMLEVRKKDG